MISILARNKFGFTLFELLMVMAVFAIILIIVLESVYNISIARTRTNTRVTLMEELYFFSENLITTIKDGGTIDYEEYWNRQVVGTETLSGHYAKPTGFGNYGSGGVIGEKNYGWGYYYCTSSGSSRIGSGGCLTGNNSHMTRGTNQNQNYSGVYQRYGQYKLQFTDYNGNADSDLGDEDNDESNSILNDEDDRDIGDGPIVISGSSTELYLINEMLKERLYFRWTYTDDPGLPPNTCTYSGSNAGSGCLGNIEILRLKGLDYGMTHSGDTNDPTAFDGIIDTWVCHPDWNCLGPQVGSTHYRLPTGSGAEWVRMFPDYVNVKSVKFTVYPTKDPWKSWSAEDCFDLNCTSPFIHPYVRLELTMGLAWEKRKTIAGDDPSISLSTTISLASHIIQ